MVLRFARAIIRLPVRKRAPSPRIYAPPGAMAKGDTRERWGKADRALARDPLPLTSSAAAVRP